MADFHLLNQPLGNIISSRNLDKGGMFYYFAVVHKISFRYENAIHRAMAKRFVGKRNRWYQITLLDGSNFVIIPETIPTSNHQVIWRQQQIPGELYHPEDYIQSVGRGLQDAGLH